MEIYFFILFIYLIVDKLSKYSFNGKKTTNLMERKSKNPSNKKYVD